MGRVQQSFINGVPGSVSRSVDDIIISIRNASGADIPFGTPVFVTNDGAAPFDLSSPQEFDDFLGFAVRVADKTPDTYPNTQNPQQFSQTGVWKAGDVMEVLVRGSIVIRMATAALFGDRIYLRKSDGQLTPNPGTTGTTICLENVRVRGTRDTLNSATEVVVTERNAL